MTIGVLEIAGLVSVAINAALAIWGVAKKRKLDAVSDGLAIVEQAIDDNKTLVDKAPHGRAITRAIKAYGPHIVDVVDAARRISHQVSKGLYETRAIEAARREHTQRNNMVLDPIIEE